MNLTCKMMKQLAEASLDSHRKPAELKDFKTASTSC